MSEQGKPDKWFISEATDREDNILVLDKVGLVAAVTTEDDAHLIVAAPHLLDAIKVTRALVSEAAMTGFRWDDGDWAERLFENQRVLAAAIAKATGAS